MSETYHTVLGDMWDSIAFSQLGDVKYTDLIMSANPKYKDVYVFSSGCEIEIHNIQETVTSNDLPPWKKVSG